MKFNSGFGLFVATSFISLNAFADFHDIANLNMPLKMVDVKDCNYRLNMKLRGGGSQSYTFISNRILERGQGVHFKANLTNADLHDIAKNAWPEVAFVGQGPNLDPRDNQDKILSLKMSEGRTVNSVYVIVGARTFELTSVKGFSLQSDCAEMSVPVDGGGNPPATTTTTTTTTSTSTTMPPKPPSSCQFEFLGNMIPSGSSVIAFKYTVPPNGYKCTDIREVRTCKDGVLSGSYNFGVCFDLPAPTTTTTTVPPQPVKPLSSPQPSISK